MVARVIPVRTLLVLLCAHLSACAGLSNTMQPSSRDAASAAFEERIATDTVRQIARLYPPARTRLNVVSVVPDHFGALLAAKLRGQGFGVEETVEARTKVFPFTFSDEFRPRPTAANVDTGNAPIAAAPGLELRYLLDPARAGMFSRVTVRIGGAVLARAYLVVGNDTGAAVPAGAWTYRGENGGGQMSRRQAGRSQ
jgi:hypothetical protein